jgi:hypothetical protein
VTTNDPQRPREVPIGESAVGTQETTAVTHAVTACLWLWDRLGLELGGTAVVTGGHPWSRLALQVAGWHGAIALIAIDVEPPLPNDAAVIPSAGASGALQQLASLLSAATSVCAADLSGRSEVVDLLLEALPTSSRVALVGESREHLTIDFYQNVHRKGLTLVSAVLSAETSEHCPSLLEKAQRLLRQAERRQACLAALHAPFTGRPRPPASGVAGPSEAAWNLG